MSAGSTVKERIIQDVVSVIEAIVAPSYNWTVETVRRQEFNIQTIQEYPSVVVVDQGVDQDDSRLGLIVCSLSLTIMMVIRTAEPGWPEQVELLVSDVCNALRNDPQRGGLAVKTAVTQSEYYDGTELGAEGVAGAQILVDVSYRHLYNDTTVAL